MAGISVCGSGGMVKTRVCALLLPVCWFFFNLLSQYLAHVTELILSASQVCQWTFQHASFPEVSILYWSRMKTNNFTFNNCSDFLCIKLCLTSAVAPETEKNDHQKNLCCTEIIIDSDEIKVKIPQCVGGSWVRISNFIQVVCLPVSLSDCERTMRNCILYIIFPIMWDLRIFLKVSSIRLKLIKERGHPKSSLLFQVVRLISHALKGGERLLLVKASGRLCKTLFH